MKKFIRFLDENKKIIIPITIIAVPMIIFATILIVAAARSNTVIVGNRYRNDLNPSITEEELSQIEFSVDSISNVENVEVNLKTSQLRILVDANDSITDEDAEALCKNIYNIVNSTLPISTYFTKDSQGQKMYDLEITVFNNVAKESDYLSYTIVKNSTMEDYEIGKPSEAKDPDLVEELLLKEEQRKNPTADIPETTPQFEEEIEEEFIEDIEE